MYPSRSGSRAKFKKKKVDIKESIQNVHLHKILENVS